jgi:hypothetical protein
VTGDVRKLHKSTEFSAALFQVASQFNLLEMVCPSVRPEDGVSRYQHDRTQGPACAIAAGAATIYRNYFVPIGDQLGQTHNRQLDGLADVGVALSHATGLPVTKLWQMKNGYALCQPEGLDAITDHLAGLTDRGRDEFRALLRIGVHRDVEVTDSDAAVRPLVSQAFCSAMPVAYTGIPRDKWRAFATLVLEAAYEATLWAAVLNAQRGASNVVLLTRLGGGTFGNDEAWIDGAMERALQQVREFDLNVYLVSFRTPTQSILAMERRFA